MTRRTPPLDLRPAGLSPYGSWNFSIINLRAPVRKSTAPFEERNIGATVRCASGGFGSTPQDIDSRPPAGTTRLRSTWQISPALGRSLPRQCAVENRRLIVADQNNPTTGESSSLSSLSSLSSDDGMDTLQALQGTDASGRDEYGRLNPQQIRDDNAAKRKLAPLYDVAYLHKEMRKLVVSRAMLKPSPTSTPVAEHRTPTSLLYPPFLYRRCGSGDRGSPTGAGQAAVKNAANLPHLPWSGSRDLLAPPLNAHSAPAV
ncbi:hypothetical protein BDK51DRAFT_37465 [Blyttiomyces helicus]|uniref:Uncharacterized protein n=1 Tax=Blyttiomyces helicus TaxID=388810 RepID=A0A4V1IR94_9FUNG|nr:hypothetical protein BDK51DRAFT_37465 [Blyttiomyces helicus]|eukprot:RKO89267.1 hypothetical protein BDK51DRAFT_37465 [Blyttiomyces helicus]